MQVLTEGRRPPVCSEACLCSWGWGCTAWCTSLTVAARDMSGSAGSPWDPTTPASTRQTQHSPPVLTGVTLSPTCQSYITSVNKADTALSTSTDRCKTITSVNKADTALSTGADRCNTITDLSVTSPVSARQTQHSPSVLKGATLSLTCWYKITRIIKADTMFSTSADRCNTITDLLNITSINRADTALSTSADTQ